MTRNIVCSLTQWLSKAHDHLSNSTLCQVGNSAIKILAKIVSPLEFIAMSWHTTEMDHIQERQLQVIVVEQRERWPNYSLSIPKQTMNEIFDRMCQNLNIIDLPLWVGPGFQEI